jgi:hypothetical protein
MTRPRMLTLACVSRARCASLMNTCSTGGGRPRCGWPMAHTLLQRSSGLTWKATTARVVVAILAPLYCPRMSFGEARGLQAIKQCEDAPRATGGMQRGASCDSWRPCHSGLRTQSSANSNGNRGDAPGYCQRRKPCTYIIDPYKSHSNFIRSISLLV